MASEIKRQQIMQAAEKLFTCRHLHEITLDQVAVEAGVGKGTIYRYFQDKDDLFFQTTTAGFEELGELLEAVEGAGLTFREQLVQTCRELVNFYEHRRQLFHLMVSLEGRMHWLRGKIRDTWMAQHAKLVASVARTLARGVEEGEVRSDVSCEVLAGLLLGMLRTPARDLPELSSAGPLHELVVEVFIRGAGRVTTAVEKEMKV